MKLTKRLFKDPKIAQIKNSNAIHNKRMYNNRLIIQEPLAKAYSQDTPFGLSTT